MSHKNKILTLLPYEDPLLRVKAQRVEFPLSDETKELIENMLYSVEESQLKAAEAPWPSAAGMAAPQWGVSKQIFVIRRKFLKNNDTSKSDIFAGGTNDFAVVINPEYSALDHDDTEEEAIEGCFSVPRKSGVVRRYKKIKVKFQTPNNEEEHELFLEGWPARVFQHETDHVQGRLYDDPSAGRCSKLMNV